MTGGLAYVHRDAWEEEGYHKEFLRTGAVGGQEEEWLRQALREHMWLTGSLPARLLLRSTAPLPLLRLEPFHIPSSFADTWAPILKRWAGRTATALRAMNPVASLESQAAGKLVN
jgi:hypothetical protein